MFVVNRETSSKKTRSLYLPFKRMISIFGSILAILLFFWFLLLICLIQKCTSKGPILFKQERCGKDGKTFNLLKFRSMKIDAPKNMTSEEIDDLNKYVTKFGKFLRMTSLDEWPQLFNILKGDMAFIGPRPLINEKGDLITIKERYENGSIKLRPGMAGLAQLNGRVNLDPVSKGKLDGEYYNKISLWFDIKLFFLTIFKVFRSDDVSKEDK